MGGEIWEDARVTTRNLGLYPISTCVEGVKPFRVQQGLKALGGSGLLLAVNFARALLGTPSLLPTFLVSG